MQFDPRTRLLPIRLLFHDRFDMTKTLAHLPTPKLLLYFSNDEDGRYYEAADPKQRATVTGYADENYLNEPAEFSG